MAYQVPPAHRSIGQDTFVFGPDTGDEFFIRRVNLLKVGELEKLEQSTQSTLNFFGAAGTAQGDFIRSLTQSQFQALVDAWRKDSGVTAGE